MGLPPNRMEAYRAARAAEAQPDPSTSILDLDPDAFVAALDELGLPAEERAFVEQQYFAQNRALPMTERPEGKRVGMVAPIAFPEGMTGAEALMSGDFEFTAPEFLRGMYEAPAEAANVAGAAARGVPVTEQQMQEAAQGAAEVFTGIGPARALVRGQALDPNVVSMSGARGMGDNGGPAMPPQRYINPNTGLYSPSFEAARALPQEVGTAQQMRAMLLKGGAKEEELVYSGFDEWLKGKDKVTKQEIEDVLGASAAGYDFGGIDPSTGFETFAGNMPYVRESYGSKGVVGTEDMDLESQRDRVIQRMRQQATEDRNARMDSELLGRGYRPIQFADENEYRQMADKVRALYDNPRSRGGLGPDGERLPPARIMNAITQVDSMMRRQGRPFEDPEVQRILLNLSYDDDYRLGPSGLPEYTDEVVRRELPDFATNPYFGSLPMRDLDEIQERAYNMSEQDIADQLGVSVEDMLDSFQRYGTEYGSYAPKGLKNYSENLYKFDDAGRGVLSGIEALGVRRFSQPHFPGKGGDWSPTMFHTRTGTLQTPDGPAYHLAEIQSDIGQSYQKYPDRFFVPGSTPTTLEISKPQRAALQSYFERAKETENLYKDIDDRLEKLYDSYLDEESGALMKDAPGYEEAVAEIRAARQRARQARDELMQFEEENDSLFSEIEDFYGNVRTFSYVDAHGGEFSADRFAEILAGTAKPRKGYGPTLRDAALPFATSTNRWVDAALKNEIINAAKSGAEWITLPMGRDVASYTFGDVAGQTEFYEKIVPRRLKELSKKFLDGAEIQQIEAKGFGPDAPTYLVNGIRLTPKLRAKLLEEGLPSFAKGGPVNGSSLDVDLFAFP